MSNCSRDQKRKKKLAERERWRRRRRARFQGYDSDEDAAAQVLSERIIAAVHTFVTEMGCEEPEPIERIPGPSCEACQCHDNVMKKVHFDGGRPVWGWHFSVNTSDPNDFRLDTLFHAVWESPDGALIDITPPSERVLAGRKAGVFTPLPFFCEDKRYFKEWEVEDLSNGMLGFSTVRQVFPEQECLSTRLGIRVQC
jgi:hypothetical protein